MPETVPTTTNSPDTPSRPATIGWQDGLPFSQQYDDVYFSRDSGLAETHHVFIQHNRLEQRWRDLQGNHFTIAETGFGTGLNFLCAWQQWLQQAPSHARLHFVSCEKHPLKANDLKQALELWPSLKVPSSQLVAQYHSLPSGMHRLIFEQGRIVLTLLIGDASDMLSQLHASVDAWFLDGFAPAKNPDMWQAALYAQVARLSNRNTTFATFTSAGAVRRGLQEAGFKVEKVAGFGSKREMLCGSFGSGPAPVSHTAAKALVIGGGIAGCASSHALASRGWQVTLIERHASIASEASGNPAGMLYPRLAMQETVMSRLALGGFLYGMRLLNNLGLASENYNQCGLLQLAFDAREAERCKAISNLGLPEGVVQWVEASEASRIAGITLTKDALYFPCAGWVNPPAFCEALSRHPNIKLKLSSEVIRIEKNHGLWQAWDGETLLDEAPVLIMAAANASLQFKQAVHLPLQPVRGQISIAPASELSQQLKTVLCTDGYISPAINGNHCMGATFSPDDTALDIRHEDHLANLKMLGRISIELQQSFKSEDLRGRAALRVATADYLPLVGELMDADALRLTPPRHYSKTPALPYLEGLYINTGHGSKGITQAAFCADILASAICGEPLPADSKLVAALDPNRFLLRKLGLKHLVSGLTSHATKQPL